MMINLLIRFTASIGALAVQQMHANPKYSTQLCVPVDRALTIKFEVNPETRYHGTRVLAECTG